MQVRKCAFKMDLVLNEIATLGAIHVVNFNTKQSWQHNTLCSCNKAVQMSYIFIHQMWVLFISGNELILAVASPVLTLDIGH